MDMTTTLTSSSTSEKRNDFGFDGQFDSSENVSSFVPIAHVPVCGRSTNIPSGHKKSQLLRNSDSSDAENSSSSCNSSDTDSDDRRHGGNWKQSRRSSKKSCQPESMDVVQQGGGASANKAFADASQLLQNQSVKLPSKMSPVSKFNIWSNVLAEQELVQDLNLVGVKRDGLINERDCESYDYTSKYRMMNANDPHDVHRRLGLKRSSADRRCNDSHLPMLNKNKRSFTLSEDDTDEKVVSGIATILREPKMDLIGRIVSTLGTKKSIELLRMTEDIEEAGGLMTLDNSRRRTPGGVFLQLVRTDKFVSKTEKDTIFEMERAEYIKSRKASLKAKKRRANQRKKGDKKMEVTAEPDALLPPLPKLGDLIALNNGATAALNPESGLTNPDKMEEPSDSEKEPGELNSDSDTTD